MSDRRFLGIILLAVALAGCLLASGALGQGSSTAGPLHIGISTDLHANAADSPAEHKVMIDYPARLSAYVDAMNAWPADLVVDLGDFVNGAFVLSLVPAGPAQTAAQVPAVLANAESVYARFSGPRYHVLGNHDIYDLSKEEFLAGTGAPWTYGSFDAKGYHLVILDVQYTPKDAPLGHATWVVQGWVPQVELDWLKADLAATGRPTIVCVHQRLDGALEKLNKKPQVLNADVVRGVLETSGVVIAVFQGHDHTSAYTLVNGIHYIAFAALVNEGTPPSWAQVTLDPSGRTIDIVGVGLEVARHLTY